MSRKISSKDFDLILNALKDPPAPNATLIAASKKAMAACRLDENGKVIYEIDYSHDGKYEEIQ